MTASVGVTGVTDSVGATGVTASVGVTGLAGATGATGLAGATGFVSFDEELLAFHADLLLELEPEPVRVSRMPLKKLSD